MQCESKELGQRVAVNDSLTSGDNGIQLRRQLIDVVAQLRPEPKNATTKAATENNQQLQNSNFPPELRFA